MNDILKNCCIFSLLLILDVTCVPNTNFFDRNTTPWPFLGTPYRNSSPIWGRNSDNDRSRNPWKTENNPQNVNHNQRKIYNQSVSYESPIAGYKTTQRYSHVASSSNRTVNLSDIFKLPDHNSPRGGAAKTTFSGVRYTTKPTTTQSPAERNLDDLLREFSEDLLDKDVNNAAHHVRINYQGRTTSRSQIDEAPLPLLSVDRSAYGIPTISKFLPLLDNYVLQTTVQEEVTAKEKKEEEEFLNAILATPVMEHTKRFLSERGLAVRDSGAFKNTLREIWFGLYPRGGGRISSSGFEHVFLSEIKNGDVSGLHNWLYFSDQEAKGRADYLGYMKKVDLGGKGAVVRHHFRFAEIDKPVGSMFIGTSPEFEMALYTTCFLLRADKVCPLQLNNHKFVIRTYRYRYRGRDLIGSAFPDI